MNLTLTVLAKNRQREEKWVEDLKIILQPVPEIGVCSALVTHALGEIVFLDALLPGLDEFLEKLDRGGRAIFLVLKDQDHLPQAWVDGKVDDVVVAPFRSLDILSKIHYYEQIVVWKEVSEMNASFSALLQHLQDDLHLAERLQKKRVTTRFPHVRGLQVTSRYLAGLKAGSDYVDLAEAKNAKQVVIVLSHCSSYGLSSAFLSVLMRVTMKLTLGQLKADNMVKDAIRQIYDEILLVLGEKDRLALFYGTYFQETQKIRFQNFGNFSVFYSAPDETFNLLPRQGEELSKDSSYSESIDLKEEELALTPGGRLAILSYGFVEALGGEGPVSDLLNRFRDQEPNDSLNELTYQVKSKLESEDDMPSRDCTAIIFDVESPVVRKI